MKEFYEEKEIFRNNCTSLREASKDDNGTTTEYMTFSELDVVNFDAVKRAYIQNLGLTNVACSCDALLAVDGGQLYFIEFKNGAIRKKEVYNIYQKIYESLLIFSDIVKETIDFCRNHVNFVLVYNEEKNKKNSGEAVQKQSDSKNKIGKYLYGKKAGKNYVMFGLERFEKMYFQSVYTYNQSEFEEFLLRFGQSSASGAMAE